jgi:hypothetical protein
MSRFPWEGAAITVGPLRFGVGYDTDEWGIGLACQWFGKWEISLIVGPFSLWCHRMRADDGA